MTEEHLRQAVAVLSKCGFPQNRALGLTTVPIPKKFKCWAVFSSSPSSDVNTVQTTIEGETTWAFRAISSYVTVPVGLKIQIQFPDGRFLFHDLSDIRSIAGFGSWRYPLTQERLCPPGTRIIATFFDTSVGTAQAIPLLLEGSYLYNVRGGSAPSPLPSLGPRYVPGDPNQNIMAPCWAWGEGPEAPKGFKDDPGGYVYQSQVGAIDMGAATTKNLTLQIQVEPGSDCPVWSMAFNRTADSTAVGDVLVKIRNSTGYLLTDDWIRYGILNGVPFFKPWIVKANETIFVDLALIDYSGTGNVYMQAFANGGKRRRNVSA
jgi:hypothetical protein